MWFELEQLYNTTKGVREGTVATSLHGQQENKLWAAQVKYMYMVNYWL